MASPGQKAHFDPPVRDELARVKLDMTVCTVGHSWCSPLLTADDKVYTSHDCHDTSRQSALTLDCYCCN